MSNEWDQLELWSGRIGAAAALAGTFYGIYKAARAGISKILTISNRLQAISDQLSPNGGSSLRDAINRIEHRQIQTEQRERAFLHMHSDMMFELNHNLQLVWANHTLLKALQVDSDAISGGGWHNIVAEDDRQRTIEQFENARDSIRNVITQSKLLIAQDINQTINASIAGTVMLDSSQKTGGFLVTVKLLRNRKNV